MCISYPDKIMLPARWRGFHSRYFHYPLFRKASFARSVANDEFLSKKSEVPSNNGPPPENGQHTQKLTDLVEQSKNSLLSIKTAKPLDPFPNRVVVDINKVNIIYRYFFSSEHIHSVAIKDISDVLIETGIFFSTLKIVDIGFTETSIDIEYLRTRDAIKVRKIIQGLIVANKSGIDLSKCEFPNLTNKLEELGKVE